MVNMIQSKYTIFNGSVPNIHHEDVFGNVLYKPNWFSEVML